MKIKVIDLLVKIANNEKLPRKIRYNDNIYDLNEDNLHTYQTMIRKTIRKLPLIIDNEYLNLNEEVEIIEEPKKIGKLETYKEKEGEDYFANILKLSPNSECEIDEALSTTIDKLNELIDEINNLKEK